MLRNPKFIIGGIEPFPNNAYDIDVRLITPVDADYVNVEVFLIRYADSSKTNIISLKSQIHKTLKNLPNDSAQLNLTLYQSELLAQHGDEIVDGTALKDFMVI